MTKQRFIVTNFDKDDFGTEIIIVLSDIGYWNEHYDALIEWCGLNGCEVVGMTVDIPEEKLLTLFKLRWS